VWVLIFLFGLACVGVGWMCCGHYIRLRLLALLRPRAAPPVDCADLPFVSVVVPSCNEREQILAKYINLREQDYPRARLEVVFADGGSTDGGMELLAEHAKDDPTVWIARCPQRGRVQQLNHVLPQLRGSIVVCTDVDGQMELDGVSALVREFYRGDEVAVVGACVYPAKALDVEGCYCAQQNRTRLLESDAAAASSVVETCYAFRRSLLAALPPDVEGVGVYVAMEANARGLRTVYSREAAVSEVRGANTLDEFFSRRFRKSNVFLREALRFGYRVADLPKGWKSVYCARVAQGLLLPWAVLGLLALGASLITLGRTGVVLIGLGFVVALFAMTGAMLRRVGLPEGEECSDFLALLTTFFYRGLLVMFVGLSFPFFRLNRAAERPEGKV